MPAVTVWLAGDPVRLKSPAEFTTRVTLVECVNVPLTPDVVDAVNSVAEKQGLSGPAWIAMTIDDALQQQRTTQRQ